MNAYSKDLRERVVTAYLNKEGTQEEIGKRFSVHRNTVYNWIKQYKKTGNLKAKEYKSGPASKIEGENLLILKKLTETYKDATLEEYSDYFQNKTNIKVSSTTIFRTLKKLKITLKKNKSTHHKEILIE